MAKKKLKTIRELLAEKVIAVDFDNTIVATNDINEIMNTKENAINVLNALRGLGYKILIYSCRNNKTPKIIPNGDKKHKQVMQDMIDYLKRHNIPYDRIDAGKYGKPFAHYYIDDKGIRFNNNWLEILEFIIKKENEQK
jgi:capsule biosynthesis phosphatase